MKKLLVICHDYWHPGDIVQQGLAFLETENQYDLTTLRNMEDIDLSAFDFDDYHAVLVCKDNRNSYEDAGEWLTEAIARKFTTYVETGGCLVVLHAGIVAPNSTPIFKELVGCGFEMHPEQCPVTYLPTGTTDITDNVNAFTEHDEHYKINIYADDITVFLDSESQFFTEVAGYYRIVGTGIVIVMSPGHNLPVWLNPEYQKLLKNTLEFEGGL